MAEKFTISMSVGDTTPDHAQRDVAYVEAQQDLGKLQNVDVTKTADNERIVYMDKTMSETFNEIFENELNEYNAKQKRKDRKINDYYEFIQNQPTKTKSGKKTHPMKSDYEYVLQFGNKDGYPKEAKEMLRKTVEKLLDDQIFCKYFNINYANTHMDESTPHTHINITPKATGYSKGMKKRPSMSKATVAFVKEKEQLNISREFAYENILDYIKDDVMQGILEDYDYEREVVNEQRKHVSKRLYVNQKENERLEKSIEELMKQEDALKYTISLAEKSREKIKNDVVNLKDKKNCLVNDINSLNTTFDNKKKEWKKEEQIHEAKMSKREEVVKTREDNVSKGEAKLRKDIENQNAIVNRKAQERCNKMMENINESEKQRKKEHEEAMRNLADAQEEYVSLSQQCREQLNKLKEGIKQSLIFTAFNRLVKKDHNHVYSDKQISSEVLEIKKENFVNAPIGGKSYTQTQTNPSRNRVNPSYEPELGI